MSPYDESHGTAVSEGMKRHWQVKQRFKCKRDGCSHIYSNHTEVYVNLQTETISLGSDQRGHKCNVKNCECTEFVR